MSHGRTTPASTRRTVLRVGGMAAWTAPAIIAAGSVPAFAASGALRATQTAVRSGPNELGEGVDFNATIYNDTANPVTLSVRVTAVSQGNTWTNAFFADGSIGWSLLGFTGFGTSTVTLDWQGASPIPVGGSVTFHELLALTPAATYTPGTVSLTLMPVAPATAVQPAPASYPGGAAPRPAPRQARRGANGPSLLS